MANLTEAEFALLAENSLLCHMSSEDLRRAVGDGGCRAAAVAKGEVVFSPHEFSRALGILLAGRLCVSKEGFVVSTLAPGDLFGAAALFNDREDYATTLTARTDCRMVFFSQALVKGILTEHVGVAGAYIRYLSGRIRFLEGKLDALLAGSAQQKLAQYLMEREGDVVTLDGPISGLARRLDVSRASLYRAFDGLVAAGAIEKTGKTVRILKEEALL